MDSPGVNFTVPLTGTYIIHASGSGYALVSTGVRTFSVNISEASSGTQITSDSITFFFNTLSEHHAFPPQSFEATLTAGTTYNAQIEIPADTTSDNNDIWTLDARLKELQITNTTTITNISAGGGAFYGSLKWDTTTNCEWEVGGITLTSFAADADCDDNVRTARGLTTSVVTAADAEGQLPQIKFASMPAGYYKMIATGSLRIINTTGISCEFAFNHDLTNQNTSSATIHYGSSKGAVTSYEGEFFFSTDQGASTISLYGAEYNFDGCTIDVTNDNGNFEIAVYYFPSFGSAVNSSVIANDAGDTRVEIVGAENIITTFIKGIKKLVFGNSTINSTAAIEIYNATDKFGGFRYNDNTTKLQFSHDNGTTWENVGSGGGSGGGENLSYARFTLSVDGTGIAIPFDEGQGDTDVIVNNGGNITLPAGTYRITSFATRQANTVDYELYDVTNSVTLEKYTVLGTSADSDGSTAPYYFNITSSTVIQIREGNGDSSIIWNGRQDGISSFTNSQHSFSSYIDIQQVATAALNQVVNNISAAGGAFYGSLNWEATTGCNDWSTVSTSFSNFSDAECDDNARTAMGLTTSIVTVGNAEGQIPQIKFDSIPAGYYLVEARGYFQTNSSEACVWRFTDGSSFTDSYVIGGGSQFAGGGILAGEFFYSADQGATTIQVQGRAQATNTCSISVEGSDRDFQLVVYYFPSFGTAKNDTVFSDLDGDTRINVDGGGGDSDNITFFTAGGQRVVIDNSGNVGIGTTSPETRLHVNSSDTLSLSNQDSYALKIEQANEELTLGVNSTHAFIQSFDSNYLTLNAAGNDVLVGTTSDSGTFTLQVSGDICETNAGTSACSSDRRLKKIELNTAPTKNKHKP